MLSRSHSRRHGLRSLFLAGALGLGPGLCGLLPLDAQEPGPPAQSGPRGGTPATRQPVTPTLRARVRAQQLTTRKAEAAFKNAKLNREVAEIAVQEYAEGFYPQDLASLEGEIKLAESDLVRAEDRVEWAKRMFDKGFVSQAQKVAEEQNLQKAKGSLEQAQAKKKLLLDYTKAQTIKELQTDVEKARAKERAKELAWEREKTREAEMARQLAGTDGTPPALRDEPEAPAQVQHVCCDIEGQTRIIFLALDGSTVKKGHLVCVLDAAPLRDKLTNQAITASAAEANYQNARLAREEAELAIKEYLQGAFALEDLETASDIPIASGELALAEDELAKAKSEKANDPLPARRAELAVFRARFMLEKAELRRKILLEFTKGKQIKKLHRDVEMARSQELSKQAIVELEKSKVEKLKRQIDSCRILAPIDGILLYAKLPFPLGADTPAQTEIAKGATVREHQLLFRIVPPSGAKSESP
jgi:hypothetical protein